MVQSFAFGRYFPKGSIVFIQNLCPQAKPQIGAIVSRVVDNLRRLPPDTTELGGKAPPSLAGRPGSPDCPLACAFDRWGASYPSRPRLKPTLSAAPAGEADAFDASLRLAEFDPGALERAPHHGERRPLGRAPFTLEIADRKNAHPGGVSDILNRPPQNVTSSPALCGGQRHGRITTSGLAP
jgi:hypothetical protein